MSEEYPEAQTGPEAIAALIDSAEFQALCNYRPPFNVLRALGIQHKEHPHSNFLAFLLDPMETHGLGKGFLEFLLHRVESNLAHEVESIRPEDIRVHREYEFIDVLVECGAAGPVIGIEVKIWAAEQTDQIRRYQDMLTKRFGRRTERMIYLTLNGTAPETQDRNSDVTCLSLSWSFLLDEGLPLPKSDPGRFLSHFREHIDFMINGDSNLQDIVKDLFKDPMKAQALRRAMEIRQTLFNDDVAERLKRSIHEICQVDTKHRWEKNELLLEVNDGPWPNAPIYFVFYDWQTLEFPSGMHVFVAIEDPRFREDAYLAAMNSYSGQAIQSLQRATQWWHGWRLALPVDSTDRRDFGWRIPDESFGDSWIEAATRCFDEAFRQLKPIVERYSAGKASEEPA